MENQWSHDERRRYIRITKHFIISYYDKSDPEVRHSVSQLNNVSMGGMSFIALENYAPSTKMAIKLKTPYIEDTVYIEGAVLECREKIKNMIYEIRLSFDPLSTDAEIILKKIVETFTKISGEK